MKSRIKSKIAIEVAIAASILFLFPETYYGQLNTSTITAEFKGSGGLELDEQGNLIIGDFGDFLSVGDGDGQFNKVMILDDEFNLSVYSDGFIGASGNNIDNDGIFYQSDIGAHGIYKVVNGNRILFTNNGIQGPVGIVFDAANNLFVCNCHNNTIQKVTPSGNSTLFASGFLFNCPNGITVDEDDNLYVSNFSDGNIIKITPDGESSFLNATPGGSTGGPSNGHLEYYEPTRTLYIASHGSNIIYSLLLDNPSELIHVAGSGDRGNEDGDALSCSFSRPNGIAVSTTGDSLYVNSAIPTTNSPNNPLNPQVIRLISGLNSTVSVSTIAPNIIDWNIFPNPTNDYLNIQIENATSAMDLQIDVLDSEGRKMYQKNILNPDLEESQLQIDMTNYAPGNYMILIRIDDQITGVKKITKGN